MNDSFAVAHSLKSEYITAWTHKTRTHTHIHCVSYIVKQNKISLSMIYKRYSSGAPKNVPTRILDIAIFVGIFCLHNLGFDRTTHTQITGQSVWKEIC